MKEEQGMVDLLEYALKIGERKYDEERDREDALISQASQMQTVFSIVTAVLLGAAAIFADHRGNIPTLPSTIRQTGTASRSFAVSFPHSILASSFFVGALQQ